MNINCFFYEKFISKDLLCCFFNIFFLREYRFIWVASKKREQKYELFIASHRSRQQVFMWTDNGQVIEMTGSTCLPRRGWWKCVSRHALIGVCGPFSCSQKSIDLQRFFFQCGKSAPRWNVGLHFPEIELPTAQWVLTFGRLNWNWQTCQEHPPERRRVCGIFGTCLLFSDLWIELDFWLII